VLLFLRLPRLEKAVIHVGIDWSEKHHDVVVTDEQGSVRAQARVPEGIDGVARLHALIAEQAEDPAQVMVGIELDRGLLVGCLVAAGYQVYAINPKAVDRYRDRHSLAGAKSDPGDALVLADIVRTDRHHHRQVAGDSDLVEAVKVTARAHQRLIWTRQRQVSCVAPCASTTRARSTRSAQIWRTATLELPRSDGHRTMGLRGPEGSPDE
jgi:hypothetical protein